MDVPVKWCLSNCNPIVELMGVYCDHLEALLVLVYKTPMAGQSLHRTIQGHIWQSTLKIGSRRRGWNSTPISPTNQRLKGRRRWLSSTIVASLVLDSTGFWVRTSARTLILRSITTGEDITGGFCPGAGFPSCHKSIYRVSEDNFRGSVCESEWMLISVKRWGVGLS
jgi:hypothetical protein